MKTTQIIITSDESTMRELCTLSTLHKIKLLTNISIYKWCNAVHCEWPQNWEYGEWQIHLPSQTSLCNNFQLNTVLCERASLLTTYGSPWLCSVPEKKKNELNVMEQVLAIPKLECERYYNTGRNDGKNAYILKEPTTKGIPIFHSCKYSILVFTDSVSILFDQAMYNTSFLTSFNKSKKVQPLAG
jgi:hypothetical protein